MNNLWTMGEVADATQGRAQGDGAIARVVIDSRDIRPGDLFVAIRGERFDGHDFVASALEKGATAALVSHRPQAVPEHAPLITVADPLAALHDLARAARQRAKGRLVAVTGSVGKTSAKEALKLCLSASGGTHASKGNLNNHIGLPLSLANLPADAAFGVFELGMNHAGEILALSKLLRPHVALITTVEAVHLEFFESVEAIADAKAEIFAGLEKGGVAVLPADNPHFARLAQKAEGAGGRILAFGTGAEAAYRLESCRMEEAGTQMVARLRGTPVTYRVAALGRHWGLLTVAVLAAAEAAGGDLAKAAFALANFREPVGRGRAQLVKMSHGEITLIDDSYNASPASMQAAFEKLREVKEAGTRSLRTVAVLGDMLELGPEAQALHVGLVPSLVNNQIDLVFAAGPMMGKMFQQLPPAMRGAHANDAEALAPHVLDALLPRDLVLVKGSNGSRMHRLAQQLRDAGETDEKEPADAV